MREQQLLSCQQCEDLLAENGTNNQQTYWLPLSKGIPVDKRRTTDASMLAKSP